MAKIVIKRKKALVDRYRNYSIFLDGEKICSIANGEEYTFELSSGKHILSGKIDWNTSNAIIFEIKEEHTILFTIRGCNPFFAIYYTLVKPQKYLKLKKQGYL